MLLRVHGLISDEVFVPSCLTQAFLTCMQSLLKQRITYGDVIRCTIASKINVTLKGARLSENLLLTVALCNEI